VKYLKKKKKKRNHILCPFVFGAILHSGIVSFSVETEPKKKLESKTCGAANRVGAPFTVQA
jgi:hypothetical protein